MQGDLKARLLEVGDRALAEIGCYVVDVEVEFGRARSVLRFFLDGLERQVTVDDCAKGSRLLQHGIDEGSVFGGNYVLEVSSPGLERRVARPRDYLRFQGRGVKVRMRSPLDGRRNFEGTIAESDDESVTIAFEGQRIRLPLAMVARAQLTCESLTAEGRNGAQPQHRHR